MHRASSWSKSPILFAAGAQAAIYTLQLSAEALKLGGRGLQVASHPSRAAEGLSRSATVLCSWLTLQANIPNHTPLLGLSCAPSSGVWPSEKLVPATVSLDNTERWTVHAPHPPVWGLQVQTCKGCAVAVPVVGDAS